MSVNVSVVSLDIHGKDGMFTVVKIEVWIQQTLQIMISYLALKAKVLMQGLYPGVGKALIDLVVAAGFPAPELMYPVHLNPEAATILLLDMLSGTGRFSGSTISVTLSLVTTFSSCSKLSARSSGRISTMTAPYTHAQR